MMLEGKTHYDAIVHGIDYCMITPERGLVLKPQGNWEGISMDYKFEVRIRTDSDCAKCSDMRKSITGSVVYLSGAWVMFKGSTQKMMTLSTTKVELNTAVMGVQGTLFMKNTEITGAKGQVTYTG